jgi:hypothetical protein
VTLAAASPPTPESRASMRARLLAFAAPLVATSWLMTVAGPLLDVALTRTREPRVELAAFWLAFAVALTLQSAGNALQSATLALADSPAARARLMLAAVALGGLGVALALLGAGPAGGVLFERVLPTSARVAARAREVLGWLAPLPLLTALRGLAGGMALRARRSQAVAAAALARTAVLAGVVGAAVASGRGAGAGIAALALVAGALVETAMIGVVALRVARADTTASPAPSPVALWRAGAPLLAAALAWTLTRPLVNAVLGRLADPELAQAAFGVVLPILMVSCSPLWALQESSVVLPHGRDELRHVVRHAAEAALVFAGVVALVALTPLRDLLLARVFRLPADLTRAVGPALALLVFEPPVLAARAVAQGVLLRTRRTGAFLVVAPLRAALQLGVGLTVAERFPHAGGAALGLLLLIGGDAFDALAYGARAWSVTRATWPRAVHADRPGAAERPALTRRAA